jgi:hypothetical protein
MTQKVDTGGDHTAMLGINVVGVNDPVVNNGNEISIAEINIAFWGPDFTPSDLEPLDPEGRDLASGVLLWEDADLSGVFMNGSPLENYNNTPNVNFDGVLDGTVGVRNMAWATAPEPIDLDGDGAPNDLNGDGSVDDLDHAWVLTLIPEVAWEVPHDDVAEVLQNARVADCSVILALNKGAAEPLQSRIQEYKPTQDTDASKQLDVNTSQPGDDLFMTIRTSENMQRFEKFRAVVPATLPSRGNINNSADANRLARAAGIKFFPQINTSGSAFTKSSPDEDPVQDLYGHDMLEVNVPVRLVDMTSQGQTITSGGAAMPAMGLDISTNIPENTLVEGVGGTGAPNGFVVASANWLQDAYAGDWLVDSEYTTFEIIGNSDQQLFLHCDPADTACVFGPQPADGAFKIVRDPTFLEQVIVDLFNEGTPSDFNPLVDLLPLDRDQTISGVALYRDNDNHPDNRNGSFDPDIDIPLTLDASPRFSGRTAEDLQIKFVFSSPGTDDFPILRLNQTINRQWVPNSFGDISTDENSGPEIFVVLRASQDMAEFTNFRVGIVNWGPNTPTEPDPDTWAGLEAEARTEFTKFQEFPWGSRAVGFISYFKEPQKYYFMDGNKSGQREDNSGFNWIRSHSSKKRRTAVVTAREPIIGPNSVLVESVSETSLPSQTTDDGFSFVISGRGFGDDPVVRLSGYDLEITQIGQNGTTINVTIASIDGAAPQEPIVLIIRNEDTNEATTRSDLFTLGGTPTGGPTISNVRPRRASSSTFPVRVIGEGLSSVTRVTFGSTMMPITSINTEGTEIVVGFPVGGIAQTGSMDVSVSDTNSDQQDISIDAFVFTSKRSGSSCAAGPGGNANGTSSGDMIMLALTTMALVLGSRRKKILS